jgi:hypothetical protein
VTVDDDMPPGARPSSKIADSDRLKKLNLNSMQVGYEETLPYDVVKKLDKGATHRCLWMKNDPSSAKSIPRYITCWEVQVKKGERRRCRLDLDPIAYQSLPDG